MDSDLDNPAQDAVARTPLKDVLDTDEEGLKLIGEIVEVLTRNMGLDGKGVFEKVAAGQSFTEALAVPPEALELLYSRAHQSFAIGRIDQAEQLFRSLCVLDGTRVDFLLGYGICLRVRDDLKAASALFETVALMRPEWAVPYYHLLELNIGKEDWAGARQALASYDARSDDNIDEAMVSEVERLRKAVDLHSA